MKRLQTTSDTHSFISSILITHLIGVTSRSNKHGTVSNHLNEIKYHLWLLLPLSMPIKDNYDIVILLLAILVKIPKKHSTLTSIDWKLKFNFDTKH